MKRNPKTHSPMPVDDLMRALMAIEAALHVLAHRSASGGQDAFSLEFAAEIEELSKSIDNMCDRS